MAQQQLEKNIAEHILGVVGFGGEESAFHKDAKISGVIGEAGQKDKLSYGALLKLIEEEKNKGYSYKEIVNAAIKAVALGFYIQNVLN